MILADTNIFIDFWNNPTKELMLEAFDEKPFGFNDWQVLGNNLYKLRRKGLTVPFSDAMIATLAIKYDIPVWTGDKHFALIKNVLTDLRLFNVN